MSRGAREPAGAKAGGDPGAARPAPESANSALALPRGVDVVLALLDVAIAVGRKAGGFCALLALGWLYLRLLVLGGSARSLFPGASDPALHQTLWTALLLIMAQGWDIPLDEIAAHWTRLRGRRAPSRQGRASPRPRTGLARLAERVVKRLGRFMDLAVALANKIGALAVLVTLGVLAARVLAGATARDLYPDAADPGASMLADVCVSLVVLGWWATPFEQIARFWRRLRDPA